MDQPLLFGTINFQKLLTVAEVAKAIELLKKTGELLSPDHPTAKINFIDGRVVHARFDQEVGNDAAVKILQLRDSNVSFIIGPKIEQTTVTDDLSKLLEKAAQAAVVAAEQKASEKTIPVVITPLPQPASAAATTPAATTAPAAATVAPSTSPAPAAQAASLAQSAAGPQPAQAASAATAQTTAPHPVPDTLKPQHGSPAATAAAAQQQRQAATTTPSAASTAPQQQKQPAPGPAGTAKKPILRITLKGVSKDFPIIPGKLMTIGRTPDNDICIPDGQISSRHATLLLDAKGMHLVDQNSLNGVYFGGKKVTEIWLKPNDQFTLAEIPVIVTLA
jgi:hypothetical protein